MDILLKCCFINLNHFNSVLFVNHQLLLQLQVLFVLLLHFFISSLTNDQFKIVIGPSTSLLQQLLMFYLYFIQSTVIGFALFISPYIKGGFTHLLPYDWTQAFCVKANPSNISPKIFNHVISSQVHHELIHQVLFLLEIKYNHLYIFYFFSYSSLRYYFFKFFLFSLISGVWGNDPIVVVVK